MRICVSVCAGGIRYLPVQSVYEPAIVPGVSVLYRYGKPVSDRSLSQLLSRFPCSKNFKLDASAGDGSCSGPNKSRSSR